MIFQDMNVLLGGLLRQTLLPYNLLYFQVGLQQIF
tara:strand:+ start:6513 stop:6617 length:105 start_codon:yes stop_codon:yes gene_type:complete